MEVHEEIIRVIMEAGRSGASSLLHYLGKVFSPFTSPLQLICFVPLG